VREFSVDDRAAEGAFGGVVGRFHAGVGGEGPERGPDLEQVVGEAAVQAGALALAAGVFEQRARRSAWMGAMSSGYAYVVFVTWRIVRPDGAGLPEIETSESLHRRNDASCCPSAYRVIRHRWNGNRIASVPGSTRIEPA
jgi:hypothetical protein